MSRQNTLLTSHKGVDLHAASALLVMKHRLEGGDRLVNLLRCELHAYWDEATTMERVLNTGRYFNPNKHHYGHFLAGPRMAPGSGMMIAAVANFPRDGPANGPARISMASKMPMNSTTGSWAVRSKLV